MSFKKDDESVMSNYRPSVIGQILEYYFKESTAASRGT